MNMSWVCATFCSEMYIHMSSLVHDLISIVFDIISWALSIMYIARLYLLGEKIILAFPKICQIVKMALCFF